MRGPRWDPAAGFQILREQVARLGAGKFLAALLLIRAPRAWKKWLRPVGQHRGRPGLAWSLPTHSKHRGARQEARWREEATELGDSGIPEPSGNAGWVWAKRGKFEGLVQDWPGMSHPPALPRLGEENTNWFQPAFFPRSQTSYPDSDFIIGERKRSEAPKRK